MTNRRWIKMEDEVPSTSREYWTYYTAGAFGRPGEGYVRLNWWAFDKWNHQHKYVTHWMPRDTEPEPPGEKGVEVPGE